MSLIMIDIHCHILPLLDDGPETLGEAVAMAKRAAADGITHIVATPHVNGTYTSVEEDALAVCFHAEIERLRQRLHEEKIPVGILPGAEIYYTNLNEKNLARLGMNKTRYLLVEFPHTHLPPDAIELVYQLVNGGYYPIIAHPERNPTIIKTPKRLMMLRDMGALTQITADSLMETQNQDVMRCAFYLLKKGAVDFIATDAHSAHSRPPVLSAAYDLISKLISPQKAEELMRGNATSMLRGKPLGYEDIPVKPHEIGSYGVRTSVH